MVESNKSILFMMFFCCQFPLSGMCKTYVKKLPHIFVKKNALLVVPAKVSSDNQLHFNTSKNAALKSIFRQLLIMGKERDALYKRSESKQKAFHLQQLEEAYDELIADECPCFARALGSTFHDMPSFLKFPCFDAREVTEVLSTCGRRLNRSCPHHVKE